MTETDYYVTTGQLPPAYDGGDEPEGCIGCLLSILVFSLFAVMLFCSCSTGRTGTVVVVRDSIRTEVRTRTVYVPDTIPVALPPETVRVVAPLDTLSRIQTSLAVSEALVRDGQLHHSILNKPTIEVPVEHKETVRDSIVYREKEVPVPCPVEVKVPRELTWWQRLRLYLGDMMLVLSGTAILYAAARLYMKIKVPV